MSRAEVNVFLKNLRIESLKDRMISTLYDEYLDWNEGKNLCEPASKSLFGTQLVCFLKENDTGLCIDKETGRWIVKK